MPLVDITNPKVINFLIESYEKENRLRLNWIKKHRDKMGQAAVLSREPTNYYQSDVIAAGMADGMHSITRDHVTAGFNRKKVPLRDATFIPGVKHLRHGHSIIDMGLGDIKDDPRLGRPDSDLAIDPFMRPVDPELTNVIYKPKPEFGRVAYVEQRHKVMPEKRYYFAECVNWDYGWRITDSKNRDRPEFGRVWYLTKSLKGRVGPQPDPQHYKNSDIPGPSKCVNN